MSSATLSHNQEAEEAAQSSPSISSLTWVLALNQSCTEAIQLTKLVKKESTEQEKMEAWAMRSNQPSCILYLPQDHEVLHRQLC